MTLSRYLTKLSPLPEKLQCLFRTVDKEIFGSNSFLKGKFLYIQVYYCSLLCSTSAHHHRQHQKIMKSFQILFYPCKFQNFIQARHASGVRPSQFSMPVVAFGISFHVTKVVFV